MPYKRVQHYKNDCLQHTGKRYNVLHGIFKVNAIVVKGIVYDFAGLVVADASFSGSFFLTRLPQILVVISPFSP
jgi:hypothetical protein